MAMTVWPLESSDESVVVVVVGVTRKQTIKRGGLTLVLRALEVDHLRSQTHQ